MPNGMGLNVVFTARCSVCKEKFDPKQLKTVAFETHLCSGCLYSRWNGCRRAAELASEIGKIASAAYHTDAERKEVLESCVELSNQIQEVCGEMK